ncbi:hypothetical protein AG1IA_07472 [Rhizoctonia solani AG-1 IA]|uniref:Uncharacterized protein n=1 Tax=Thanatephorus cucumeris (strain AG1-IA) TaxID=983506 RepID=L8WKM3_THACA|nr:hypothetical protein AG1IA_07472 [Rhizoctonia solani AG-1 IA]
MCHDLKGHWLGTVMSTVDDSYGWLCPEHAMGRVGAMSGPVVSARVRIMRAPHVMRKHACAHVGAGEVMGRKPNLACERRRRALVQCQLCSDCTLFGCAHRSVLDLTEIPTHRHSLISPAKPRNRSSLFANF